MTSCPSEGHAGLPQRRLCRSPAGPSRSREEGAPGADPMKVLNLGELGVPARGVP